MERIRHFSGIPLLFSMIQQMLAIWSLVPLLFLNPVCTFGSSRLTYYWGLAWRILSITLLACEMGNVVWSFVHSLALHFFGIEMKINLFQSCGHCWVIQIYWHIVCGTLTAPSFRTWNQFSSVQSCLTICDPIDCSMPGFPVHHQLWSLPKLMSIESVMPSNQLVLCHPLFLLPSIFLSIRVLTYIDTYP